MCYYTEQSEGIKVVKKRFNAIVDNEDNFLQSENINGFSYPNLPIITNENPQIIRTDFHWGLVPNWAQDINFRKNTLNAKIETIEEKPSFKNIIQNRCLIIATSYFEWRWNDEKGKSKDKYQIFSNEDEIFAFAGLYTTWNKSGETYNSFTMVTTEANPQMQYIHNHKKRMPIVLHKGDELAWLDHNNAIQDFAFPKYDANIIAFKLA